MSQKKSPKAGININWEPKNQLVRSDQLDYFIDGIVNKNLSILSEAITQIESKNNSIDFTLNLLEALSPIMTNSIRIGVSGSPGVGKSTFINALGKHLLELGKSVAVLAVDPSSQITKGSILGDKTRMYDLTQFEKAYIRPTPSNSTLGGVASVTKESISLCEAAGFEVILIETVGVGQSETNLKDLVDMFCLLLLPGAGDDLQGIKKGIVEISDLFIINKTDGDRVTLAKESKKYYQNAIHFQKAKGSNWIKKVLLCSSLGESGMEDIWREIQDFYKIAREEKTFKSRREEQEKIWYNSKKEQILYNSIQEVIQTKKLIPADFEGTVYENLIEFKKAVNKFLSDR